MSVTYAIWNSSDKDTNLTLTNGNLTATGVGAGFHSVRSTIGVSSGKWYWEITVNTTDGGVANQLNGIANSTAVLNNYFGVDTNAWTYYGNNGNKFNNGGTAYGGSYDINAVIGVALDMDGGTITFYVNNVSQGQAFSGITGTIYAGFSASVIDACTANFGATALTYSPPSGFNPGLYISTAGASVNTLVIGGGGGGGMTGGAGGGGGGAGEYKNNSSFAVTAQAYTIIVGVGGTGGTSGGVGTGNGVNGGDSIFSTLTSKGGGGGGGNVLNGSDGGSGGGGGYSGGTTGGNSTASGGGFGNKGGNTAADSAGGGGGGAAAVGGVGNGSGTAGAGGNGKTWSVNSTTYAGGGGGSYTFGGSGGTGGGGNGGAPGGGETAGTDGLGGGGGSRIGSGNAMDGGDGVVIIAYHTDGSDGVSTSSTGGTKTTSGAYTLHTFQFADSGTSWTMVASSTSNMKNFDGVAFADIKNIDGLAIANIIT